MTYWRLAASVSLSVFVLAAVAASAVLASIAPLVHRRLERASARRRASALLALRLLPGTAAFAAAFGLVLPTFLYFEPRDTREGVATTLLVLAVAGGLLLARAVAAGVRAWRATRRVERRWAAQASRVDGLEVSLPVFAIPDRFPTVAIVGFLRPRLFIAERVLRECPADELRAMLSHEAAHVTSRDNLKRFLMRVAPVLASASAARIERAWAAAAEEAADAAAIAVAPERRLDLAQALVRVARLAPVGPLISPVSAFYLGGSIESRVQLLLEPPRARPAEPQRGWVVALMAGAGLLVAFIAAAPMLHQAMEAVVRYLP